MPILNANILVVPFAEINPYHKLLYRELEKLGYKIIKATDLKWGLIFQLKKPGIIHLHWIDVPQEKLFRALLSIFYFTIKLIFSRLIGLKILWTIHNLIPHEHNSQFQFFKSFITTKLAHICIVHCSSGIPIVMDKFKISRNKIIVMKHGLYKGWYKDELAKNESRKKLGISDDMIVVLMFGSIRKYKNHENVIDAINKLNNNKVFLLIAGFAKEKSVSEIISTLAIITPNIKCYLELIKDDDVEVFFKSADCCIIPYTEYFTSGVVLLSLTFGIPLIIKKSPFSNEYLNNKNSIIIEDTSAECIKRAIQKFINIRFTLSVNNSADYSSLLWPNIARKLHNDFLNHNLIP
jgi:glycosyltransferase involved in cell wall biosynthesis